MEITIMIIELGKVSEETKKAAPGGESLQFST